MIRFKWIIKKFRHTPISLLYTSRWVMKSIPINKNKKKMWGKTGKTHTCKNTINKIASKKPNKKPNHAEWSGKLSRCWKCDPNWKFDICFDKEMHFMGLWKALGLTVFSGTNFNIYSIELGNLTRPFFTQQPIDMQCHLSSAKTASIYLSRRQFHLSRIFNILPALKFSRQYLTSSLKQASIRRKPNNNSRKCATTFCLSL